MCCYLQESLLQGKKTSSARHVFMGSIKSITSCEKKKHLGNFNEINPEPELFRPFLGGIPGFVSPRFLSVDQNLRSPSNCLETASGPGNPPSSSLICSLEKPTKQTSTGNVIGKFALEDQKIFIPSGCDPIFLSLTVGFSKNIQM